MRKTTGSIGVRARFTDPLRRFNEHENIRDLIEGQAARLGDKPFLVCEDDGREYSYRALHDRTTRVANLLRELGAGNGARVAMLLENSADAVFVLLGAMKSGLLAVPLNEAFSPVQLRSALEDSGASLLVTSPANWQRVSSMVDSLPGLQAVLLTGGATELGGVRVGQDHRNLAPDGGFVPVLSLDACCALASSSAVSSPVPRWWDEAALIYTESEIKNPRGVILQHRQFMTSARWLATWLKLDERERVMCTLPLFHTKAQVMGVFLPLVLGATVVISRAFSVNRFWRAVERYKASVAVAVPSMVGILTARELSGARVSRTDLPWPAAHESPGAACARDDAEAREQGLARGHDISTLRMLVCGAAPLPRAAQKAFEQCFLVPVIEGFSMAETTCFATLNPMDGTRRLGSVGPTVGNKAAIQDDRRPARPLEDNWQPTGLARMNPPIFPTAEVGEPGELCIWGENVMKEYFRRPAANPAAFAGGWFHTGDVARQDPDGFFYILGRKGEEIIRDGKRFMPREIDEALFAHAQVEMAASVGVQDARKGPQVTTWVVMRKGTFEGGAADGRLPRDAAQEQHMTELLEAHLQGRLEPGRRPTTILFLPQIPQDSSGKT
ncbi:MAG: acyl--CoA ligase, partial [Planctomycetes bacterium]|nr:acyl--CoA ligase [Planctomycetota bacterium]